MPIDRKQSDEERALAELERRRALRAASHHDDDTPREAAPVEFEDVDTGMTQRIAEDPDLARLFAKGERLKREIREEVGAWTNKLLESVGEGAHGPRIEALEKRIDEAFRETEKVDEAHDKTAAEVLRTSQAMSLLRWIAGIAIVAAVGSVGAVVSVVWSRGFSSGEIEIRIQHLERDLEGHLHEQGTRHPRDSVPTLTPTNSQPTKVTP